MPERFHRVTTVPFCHSLQWLIRETPTYSQDHWYHSVMRTESARCIDAPARKSRSGSCP